MRNKFIQWVLVVLKWLKHDSIILHVPNDTLYQRAITLATQYDSDEQAQRDLTGEWRFGQVIDRLHREFPSAKWRDLRLVIEAAVRQL